MNSRSCRVGGEQRSDRGEANVEGPDAVASRVLEMAEERRDHRGVQIVPIELGQ